MELKIKKETAKEIYDESPSGLKKILEETFGADAFKKTDYRDFKTFDDLCRATGTTESDFYEKWDLRVFNPSTVAFERLKILTKAYNQDWIFDAYNTNQKKWYPYYNILSSGFGFSHSGYICVIASTYVGSRLCFKDEETSNHAGTTFKELFEEFITAKD
jgi:hypothetical protein